ncbi:hypothetical protein NC652_017988 [Populus alba x Populus x berolinensis]|nr:hypothetical protein NC652_017988 [Populus alba x Populus x berolinensis]
MHHCDVVYENLLSNRNSWGRRSLQPGSNQNSQNPKIFEEAVTGLFSKGNCRPRQTNDNGFGGGCIKLSEFVDSTHACSKYLILETNANIIGSVGFMQNYIVILTERIDFVPGSLKEILSQSNLYMGEH